MKKTLGTIALATALSTQCSPAYAKKIEDTTNFDQFRGQTIVQACAHTKEWVQLVMDQSEGKLIFCENRKPVIDEAIPATANKKHTPRGIFPMNLKRQDADKKSTYGNAPMPWATHIKTGVGLDAVWLHEGPTRLPNGKLAQSRACVRVSSKYAQRIFHTLAEYKTDGKSAYITITQ